MNKMIIIGNLTHDPELRYTPQKVAVCNFTVAVNDRRGNGSEASTQFFRVTVWRQLAEACAKWLIKGNKVFAAGPLSVSTYPARDGSTRVSLDITANDIEFLSSRPDTNPQLAPTQSYDEMFAATPPQQASMFPSQSGFTEVETDELPF